MDEFEFHPSNWTPGNTTLDNPNYYEFMDLIERKYDDTDFRTAEEQAKNPNIALKRSLIFPGVGWGERIP